MFRLFDHLVGDGEHDAGMARSIPWADTEVDDEFEIGWRSNRHVCWFFALEDAIDVACRAAVLVDSVGGEVRDQTAVSNEETAEVDRRQFMSSGKRNDLFRKIAENALGVTIRPPFEPPANVVMMRSISVTSRASTRFTSTPNEGAASQWQSADPSMQIG